MDCPFTLNPDNLWQCTQCNWVYKIPSDKPPRRNCPRAPDIPKRTNAEITAIEKVCTLCKKFIDDGCRAFAQCGRKAATYRAWQDARCNCPDGKW